VGNAARAPSAVVAATAAEQADLGVRLQALIGQHSVLAADMMRARLRSDADFAQAADAALGKNTQAMTSLVASLFGSDAASQFSTLWADHVRSLFSYARALGARDTAGQESARAALLQGEGQLGAFSSSASQGRLPAAAAEKAVRTHVGHLLGQADAFAAGDYATAARQYRQAYAHGFEMGGALAGALLPADAVKALQTPTLRLRAAFTQLLGEHVSLVVASMRASTGDAGDLEALGSALNGNTVDMASAIDSLFGGQAARGFQDLWADHVDALMAYTAAATQDDDAARDRAVTTLRSFERSLGTFLSGAIESRIGADALTRALLMHDRMLVEELDAFAARDYGRAHDLGYQAYEEMYDLAGQLSNAIGLTLASRRPKGGSQTGGGGAADEVGRR
jgi:hypothetical protein